MPLCSDLPPPLPTDEREPEEIRDRARKRCSQILDFAEAYQRDFLPAGAASASGPSSSGCDAPAPLVARTVSVASSVAGAEPLLTRQLVHAEVLHSADLDHEPEQPEPEQEPEQDATSVTDSCPDLPDDGDDEFHPLSCSIASLRFADGELVRRLVSRRHIHTAADGEIVRQLVSRRHIHTAADGEIVRQLVSRRHIHTAADGEIVRQLVSCSHAQADAAEKGGELAA